MLNTITESITYMQQQTIFVRIFRIESSSIFIFLFVCVFFSRVCVYLRPPKLGQVTHDRSGPKPKQPRFCTFKKLFFAAPLYIRVMYIYWNLMLVWSKIDLFGYSFITFIIFEYKISKLVGLFQLIQKLLEKTKRVRV
jgi:hypothetical protein